MNIFIDAYAEWKKGDDERIRRLVARERQRTIEAFESLVSEAKIEFAVMDDGMTVLLDEGLMLRRERGAGRYALWRIVTICPKCGEETVDLAPRNNLVDIGRGLVEGDLYLHKCKKVVLPADWPRGAIRSVIDSMKEYSEVLDLDKEDEYLVNEDIGILENALELLEQEN